MQLLGLVDTLSVSIINTCFWFSRYTIWQRQKHVQL